jgi:hypothetical protein
VIVGGVLVANRLIPKTPDRVVPHSSIDRLHQYEDDRSADGLPDVLGVQPR